jgi:putative hemolysin
LLVVANHPSGALDALALLHLVGSVRRDVRIVANDLLGQVEGLRELLLPVRILGGKPSADKPDKASNSGDSPAGRATRRGRSGYGIESLRPHLREQLEMKELLRPGFPGTLER